MTLLPLHPATRRWLAHLQMVRGRHFLAAGRTPEDAAEQATRFVQELEEGLRGKEVPDGEDEPPWLTEMPHNSICVSLEREQTLAEIFGEERR